MSDQLVLSGARVYRHQGDTAMPAVSDVLIENGRIAAIGEGLADDVRPEIGLGGHLLTPGFINGHYHSHDVLAKGLFDGLSLERWGMIAGPIGSNRPLDEVKLRTQLGAIECLRNGITTIQDFSNLSPFEPEYVDAIVEGYESVGVRVVLSITVRDRSQLETILWADEMVPAEHHAIIGIERGDGLKQIRFIGEQIDRMGDKGGNLIWAISPSAPQRCSPELLTAAARFALERKIPVYTHVYETRLQRIFAREKLAAYGGSAIGFMEACGLVGPHVTIAHGVWPDEDEIARIAATGTGVVLNMLSNLRLRSGVAPVVAYRRAGVPLSLGCDNCSCSDVQSILQVMKLYCMLSGIADHGADVPTAAEAIRLATEGGARAAGRSCDLGALEPGMAADIVAFDLSDPAWLPLNGVASQLVYAETGRGLRHVWVGGRQVVRDGRCTSIDEKAIAAQLAAMMPRVRGDLDRLAAQADQVEPAFRAIQDRAFATGIGYDRYLSRPKG
jgi:5-methylthioadenosine/S-adenosylhomocysteine deaminase